VITGPGPIGLISLGIVKASGAKRVGMTGRNADEGVRFERQENLEPIYDQCRSRGPCPEGIETDRRSGCGYLVETSGGGKAIYQAFEMVRSLEEFVPLEFQEKMRFQFPMTGGFLKPFVTTSVSPVAGPPGRKRSA